MTWCTFVAWLGPASLSEVPKDAIAVLFLVFWGRSLLTLSGCGEEASGSIGDLVHVRGLAWTGVFERGAEGRDRCPVSGILGSRVSNDFGLGKCDF